MGQLARWKRRYRKAKRITSKAKHWFSNDPMAIGKQARVTHAKRSPWDSMKLSAAGKYPTPAWQTLENGEAVYGPVREGNGWIFTNTKGETVYSKAQRRADLNKKYQPYVDAAETNRRATATKKARGKLCGRPTKDGTKCRNRGKCPHHRKGLL